MAQGRMIVKEFSWDERVWNQLTERQALLFAAAIPHIETDGTLPGEARFLKHVICPTSRRVTEADLADAIKAWKATVASDGSPMPLVTDAPNHRIFFTDFERANWNLDFFRMRRARTDRSNSPNGSNKTNSSKCSSEVKGSEVKRSEEKRSTNKQIAPSAGADAPKSAVKESVERPSHAVAAVVQRYLELKGWAGTPAVQANGGFARWVKDAKALLEVFSHKPADLAQSLAVECLEDRAKEWASVSGWTLKGVAERGVEWLAEKQKHLGKR